MVRKAMITCPVVLRHSSARKPTIQPCTRIRTSDRSVPWETRKKWVAVDQYSCHRMQALSRSFRQNSDAKKYFATNGPPATQLLLTIISSAATSAGCSQLIEISVLINAIVISSRQRHEYLSISIRQARLKPSFSLSYARMHFVCWAVNLEIQTVWLQK